MTYFGVLLRFLVIPIVLLGVLTYLDLRRKRALPASLRFLSPRFMIAVLAVVAVTYTTPWDNYLVATRVWWYDPALVTGVTLGWVPIEEYTFFVLQPIMTGLWLVFLARRVRVATPWVAGNGIRITSAAVAGVIWAASIMVLVAGWQPGRYLALELAWALPPIMLQLAFGADILWHYRRLVISTIISTTLYLCGVDALAINSGTWTINPEVSLGILLGGILPVEEAVFFLLTNTLLVFGLVLGLANASFYRLPTQLVGKKINQTQRLIQ